jgi:RNA polymerase sigma factor (sigma-70 family)
MRAGDDQDLIRKVVSGDRRAFNEIVNKYKQRIFFVAMKMVRNKDDAYDITQEVFIKAFKRLHGFKGDANFYTWLCRIAINTSINFKTRDRHRGMVSVSDMTVLPESRERPDAEYDEKNLYRRLDLAVRELPPRQRAVFVMRFYDKRSHSEIAGIQGCSEGAVKANYFHALKKLRGALADIIPAVRNHEVENEVQDEL